MKRGITRVVLSITIIVMLLVGCSNHGATLDEEFEKNTDDYAENNNGQSASMDEDDYEELISIGFAQVGHESDWRRASTESAKEVFSEENGYELSFVDADNDEAAQLLAVRGFIEQQVDYIIIDPIVMTGWDTVLNEAKEAGIPVFVIDRAIDCDEDLYVAWFGSDFLAEGEAAGAWLEAYLEDKGRSEEDIDIVTIAGSAGSSAQVGRTQGFDKYIDKNVNWTKLDEQDGQFTQAGGQEVMESFLKSYDDIDVVVCQNDNEARGAMDALTAEGKTYGKDGEIIIISFDAVHDGLADVLDGKINANFECNPLAAPYVADAIQKLENGGIINNKINYIEEACFQAEDNIKTISYAGKVSEMITVTEDVLSARAY